jgi:hypothetical protein
MHCPTGGSQSLIAQNGPMTDHTSAAALLTSMLLVRLAADAGMTPTPRPRVQIAALRTETSNLEAAESYFFMVISCVRRAVMAAAGLPMPVE